MSDKTVLTKYQKRVLNKLIDKYEKSATFQGINKVHQSFYVTLGKIFTAYLDDAEYDLFTELNEDMLHLEESELVSLSWDNGRVNRVDLRVDNIDNAYKVLFRTPRKALHEQLLNYFDEIDKKLRNKCRDSISNDMLNLVELYCKYISAQRKRIDCNKSIEFYDYFEEYSDIWKVLLFLLENEEEIYVRDLSVRLFNDSKRLEAIRGKIESLLYTYGDYPDRACILEEHGIIKTPSYVMIKGNAIISLSEQRLDIGRLPGDIAFSTETLKNITDIDVTGNRVVTIENLTSFHRYDCKDTDVAIYLAGYHNRTKRDFLKSLYAKNPGIDYCHFGDIDAGGFYIYEHLKKKTGIPFITMNMDEDTFIRNKEYAKRLSSNDRVRLKKLLEMYKKRNDDNYYTVKTMLDTGMKLEQEAVW